MSDKPREHVMRKAKESLREAMKHLEDIEAKDSLAPSCSSLDVARLSMDVCRYFDETGEHMSMIQILHKLNEWGYLKNDQSLPPADITKNDI